MSHKASDFQLHRPKSHEPWSSSPSEDISFVCHELKLCLSCLPCNWSCSKGEGNSLNFSKFQGSRLGLSMPLMMSQHFQDFCQYSLLPKMILWDLWSVHHNTWTLCLPIIHPLDVLPSWILCLPFPFEIVLRSSHGPISSVDDLHMHKPLGCCRKLLQVLAVQRVDHNKFEESFLQKM